jgi:hypothetical protein
MLKPVLLSSAVGLFTLSGALAAETRGYDLSGFDSVTSSAGVVVEVEVGSDYSVTLETEGKADEAKVELNGDTLLLGRERTRGIRLGGRDTLRFTVTMPSFEEGAASSGSVLEIEGISGGNVSLRASSGANLMAEGRCDRLSVGVSSGSSLKAAGLICSRAEAEASSGGTAELHATEQVRARASSGGSIRVAGSPGKRDTKTSSGGSVQIR